MLWQQVSRFILVIFGIGFILAMNTSWGPGYINVFGKNYYYWKAKSHRSAYWRNRIFGSYIRLSLWIFGLAGIISLFMATNWFQ